MCEVPICEMSILGRVLTHWRDNDAILQQKASEDKGLEDFGNGEPGAGNGRSGRNDLVRREIRYLSFLVNELMDLDDPGTAYRFRCYVLKGMIGFGLNYAIWEHGGIGPDC